MQFIFNLLNLTEPSDSFGKSWNEIHKKERSKPSYSGGQDWKTLRTKIFPKRIQYDTSPSQPPPVPYQEQEKKEGRSSYDKKEGGGNLESLRTREEYGDGLPAEGEDSLLKPFRNVGKAALQRFRLCPFFIRYKFFFLLSRWQQGSSEQLKKKPREMMLMMII